MNKFNASKFPQKNISMQSGSPNGNKYFFEQQKQIECHNFKMIKIISEIKNYLSQQNNANNTQNNKNDDFLLHFSTQDLKDLHDFIHQKGNSLFLTGKYSEARQIILIGEFIDDELEKRGEIKNSNYSSPSHSNLNSRITSNYNSPTPSAPPEFMNNSPARPKSGFLNRRAINKIQKFDDETKEMVDQMQARHEQLLDEHASIWEKNMQAQYFKPSKTLQELRKQVNIIQKKCIQREEQLKYLKQINQKKKAVLSKNSKEVDDQNVNANDINNNEEDVQEDSNEQKFEDFGDKNLKKLNSQFEKAYQECQQLETRESEIAQEQYQNDYLESQRKIEERQMMELQSFLKSRILKRQKLLMKEGVNVNVFNSPTRSKSQFASKHGTPMNSRKNSPSKIKNISKMPPLISYSKKASINCTSPETPRNNPNLEASPSNLTKEAIMQLTPNIMVDIPSSPALIAIEDKIKQNHDKLKNLKPNLNVKNNLSPIFRTEQKTQTPPISINEVEDNDADETEIEFESKPIPFDDSKNKLNNHQSKVSKHLPPI